MRMISETQIRRTIKKDGPITAEKLDAIINEKRNAMITLRMNLDEYDLIRDHAVRSGASINRWCVDTLLDVVDRETKVKSS